MNPTGRRRVAVATIVGLIATFLVTAALTPAAAGPAPAAAPAQAVDPCPGGLAAVEQVSTDGPTMCTPGPESGLTAAQLATEGVPSPEATAGIQCYGDGTSGERVQVLYAYTTTNRLETLRSRMLRRAAEVSAIFEVSARQPVGGTPRYVRWLTDANCNLDITAVRILGNEVALDSFSPRLIPRLTGLGYSNPDRKYLVWVDTGASPNIVSGTCSGVATLYTHDDPRPTVNYNNVNGGFTRVDDKCLFAMFDQVGGKVEAHELMHTFGAVQNTAPNATPYGHCRDDYDLMCYVDGPSVTMIQPYRCGSPEEMRFDCQDNDYFSTNPPDGSYLDTRWNIANSDWLAAEPGQAQAPDPPQSLAGVPGDASVVLSWTKPAFDGGEPVVGYQVYRNGVLLPPSTTSTTTGPAAGRVVTTTSTSFTDTGRVNGATYSYQVAAVNSVGEGVKSTAVSVMAGVPRPDGRLSTSRTGTFELGDDVYATSMTGNAQTHTQPVARGASATSYVRVQNDRSGADSFKVKGVASGSPGYTVRYFRGTTDITASVAAGTYTIENLAPEAFVDLKVKITATTSAAAGSSRAATITIKSKTVKTIKDVVQTRAARS